MNEIPEIWKELNHEIICDGYMISSKGNIKTVDNNSTVFMHDMYHSSNGYIYNWFVIKAEFRINQTNTLRLFPIDELVASEFCPIPVELVDKRITVSHVDGDLTNNNCENLKWVEDEEIWKPIDFRDVVPNIYEVSNFGRIRRIDDKVLCKVHKTGSGYPCVNLRRIEKYKDSDFKIHSIHKFVGNAFVLNPENSIYINHINGIKTDSYYKNLEYVSIKNNTQHARMMGVMKGLSVDELEMIKYLILKYKYVRLAYDALDHEKYPHITRNMMTFVKFGRYKMINVDDAEFHKGRMTVDEMDMIRDLLFEYNSNPKLAFEHLDHELYPHITLQMIREIKTNKYSTYYHSNKYDLSTIKFERTLPPCKLTIEQIDEVRDMLIIMNGNVHATHENLKEKIVVLTHDMVNDIKRGKSYKRSLKYDINKYPRYPWGKEVVYE